MKSVGASYRIRWGLVSSSYHWYCNYRMSFCYRMRGARALGGLAAVSFLSLVSALSDKGLFVCPKGNCLSLSLSLLSLSSIPCSVLISFSFCSSHSSLHSLTKKFSVCPKGNCLCAVSLSLPLATVSFFFSYISDNSQFVCQKRWLSLLISLFRILPSYLFLPLPLSFFCLSYSLSLLSLSFCFLPVSPCE